MVAKATQTLTVQGAGPHEWVWSAIAAGDISAVRAAPLDFDARGVHPRHGGVLTAFLQGLLNYEGRFVAEANRLRRAKDIIEELGRRGARPDLVIPCCNVEVKGLYRNWRLQGDITPLQAVIQMRDDLLRHRFEQAGEDDVEGLTEDADILSELVDKYAELASQDAGQTVARSSIPDAIIGIWERCLADKASADVVLVSPDGRAQAHALLLAKASPVVAAMLASGMREGELRSVHVQEPASVVELFLTLLYTGCLPVEESPEGEAPPELRPGLRITVASAFMSNSARSMLLPTGCHGEVVQLDDAGDALIKFDGMQARQWVHRKNFGRLRDAATATPNLARLQEGLAGALGLAHRWQVDGLVEVLEERLERALNVETFPVCLEAAALQGAGRLWRACAAFAKNSPQVREAFQKGSYSPAAMAALRDLLDAGGQLTRKRTREAL